MCVYLYPIPFAVVKTARTLSIHQHVVTKDNAKLDIPLEFVTFEVPGQACCLAVNCEGNLLAVCISSSLGSFIWIYDVRCFSKNVRFLFSNIFS